MFGLLQDPYRKHDFGIFKIKTVDGFVYIWNWDESERLLQAAGLMAHYFTGYLRIIYERIDINNIELNLDSFFTFQFLRSFIELWFLRDLVEVLLWQYIYLFSIQQILIEVVILVTSCIFLNVWWWWYLSTKFIKVLVYNLPQILYLWFELMEFTININWW